LRECEEIKECMSLPTYKPGEEMKEEFQKHLSVETSGAYEEKW
jgi:hypothetical protein